MEGGGGRREVRFRREWRVRVIRGEESGMRLEPGAAPLIEEGRLGCCMIDMEGRGMGSVSGGVRSAGERIVTQ